MELSALATDIRILIKGLGYVLLGLFFFWIVWVTLSFSFKFFFPTPSDQADEAFGKISQPFTTLDTNKNLTFSLKTPGEKLPETPTLLPVYAIPPIEGRFTSLENGTTIARGAGLDSAPTKLNEPIWRWTSKENPHQILKLNIVTNNFVYSYDWTADPSSLKGDFQITDEELVNQANSYLNRFSVLQEELGENKTKVSYFKVSGNNRTKVGSLSEANGALVEYFRPDVTYQNRQYPVVEPTNKSSSITVLISPSEESTKQLLEINFTFWRVDAENFGTYYLKTANQAYTDLKSGKSFVATGNSRGLQRAEVTKVSLGYFNPNKETRFFQPVYVFEGRGFSSSGDSESFVAYVAALSSDSFR